MTTRVTQWRRERPFFSYSWRLRKIPSLNLKQKSDCSQSTRSIRFPSLAKVQDGRLELVILCENSKPPENGNFLVGLELLFLSSVSVLFAVKTTIHSETSLEAWSEERQLYSHACYNETCVSFTFQTRGAYLFTENFGNSGWKVNGMVTFRKFQPEIEEYVLR